MISQTAEYALRAAVCLAASPHRCLTTAELATLAHIPSGYLAKVMQSLSRAVLVSSQRGLHGGFTLTRPAREITLLDVINAVDPIPRLRPCPCAEPCSGVQLCLLDASILEAILSAEAHLQKCTIQDVVRLSVPPTAVAKMPAGTLPDGEPQSASPVATGSRQSGEQRMRYSKPSRILVDEHSVILSVIEAVESVAMIADNGSFPSEFYAKAFDFFATFADQCHHGKEEVYLFPMLEERGILRHGGPIGCILGEHDEGRSHVKRVDDAIKRLAEGDLGAGETIRRHAVAFCTLLRQHMEKENQVLFVIGDQVMSDADKELLVQQFNSAEHHSLPAGTHERYLALARELRAFARLPGTSAGACLKTSESSILVSANRHAGS